MEGGIQRHRKIERERERARRERESEKEREKGGERERRWGTERRREKGIWATYHRETMHHLPSISPSPHLRPETASSLCFVGKPRVDEKN